MKEQKMGKYKALKEYIKKCDKKGLQYFYASSDDIVSYNDVSDWDERENISNDLNALLKDLPLLYTKEEILKAGEIGEVSMIDVCHVVSLLDEARSVINDKA